MEESSDCVLTPRHYVPCPTCPDTCDVMTYLRRQNLIDVDTRSSAGEQCEHTPGPEGGEGQDAKSAATTHAGSGCGGPAAGPSSSSRTVADHTPYTLAATESTLIETPMTQLVTQGPSSLRVTSQARHSGAGANNRMLRSVPPPLYAHSYD